MYPYGNFAIPNLSYMLLSGFPVLEHVLTPRLKALQLCVTGLRNKADAIYDVTAAYSNTGEFEGPRTHAPGLAGKPI